MTGGEDRSGADGLAGFVAGMEAMAEAVDEEQAVGWVVEIADPETGRRDLYGPWPMGAWAEASVWAEALVRRFNAAGDDGVSLVASVRPVFGVE